MSAQRRNPFFQTRMGCKQAQQTFTTGNARCSHVLRQGTRLHATQTLQRGNHRLRTTQQLCSTGIGTKLALTREIHHDHAGENAEDNIADNHRYGVCDAWPGILLVVLAQVLVNALSHDAGKECDKGIHHTLNQ
ncbi:MAG: hypothetical protein QG667_460, partial [Pseudomonadota bacterium]|nr:hypothetical protein [Pseudomonadota bacterium]